MHRTLSKETKHPLGLFSLGIHNLIRRIIYPPGDNKKTIDRDLSLCKEPRNSLTAL